MKKQSTPLFDPSEIPNNLCPIATEYSTMMPGDWRSMLPVVNRKKCVKCSICWLYCPVQCIIERAGWFDANLSTCKGCGICAEECPHGAIEMIAEED
jgi:phenylglyoxylate dehydrogenase delta subunit